MLQVFDGASACIQSCEYQALLVALHAFRSSPPAARSLISFTVILGSIAVRLLGRTRVRRSQAP